MRLFGNRKRDKTDTNSRVEYTSFPPFFYGDIPRIVGVPFREMEYSKIFWKFWESRWRKRNEITSRITISSFLYFSTEIFLESLVFRFENLEYSKIFWKFWESRWRKRNEITSRITISSFLYFSTEIFLESLVFRFEFEILENFLKILGIEIKKTKRNHESNNNLSFSLFFSSRWNR